MLHIRQLAKQFHVNGFLVDALDGLDLTLKRGSVVVIMGPNGSGKSTLFRVLDGQIEPTSGAVLWELPNGKTKGTVAHVPQETRSLNFPEMLIEEHLLMAELQDKAARIWHCGVTPTRRRRYDELLRTNGLDVLAEALGRPLKTLSVGLQQILTVFLAAQGYMLRTEVEAPDLLLLDEPTSALDVRNAEFCVSLLRRLHDNGHTLLIATHHFDVVAGLADRVCLLDRGKVVREVERDQFHILKSASCATAVG